ncbi:Phosphopantetheine attachment site [compost metagenome]
MEIQGELDDHADLRQHGLDSIKFINIVVDLELELGVVVPDEELVMENMNNVARMVSKINDSTP